MSQKSPADLYADAQKGTAKLSPQERRLVIAHLEEIGEVPSNYELARLLLVDEKVIRRDRLRILRQYASSLTPTQAMSFVAKYVRNQERYLSAARVALSKASSGTLAHQQYIKLCSDVEERIMTKLQSIGIVPKELGHMSISKEEWIAEFADNGIATVRQDDGRDVPRMLQSGEEPIEVEVLEEAEKHE